MIRRSILIFAAVALFSCLTAGTASASAGMGVDAAIASIVRHQLDDLRPLGSGMAFVSIGLGGGDPDAATMQRLRAIHPNIVAASRASFAPDGSVRDTRTGTAGVLIFINGVTPADDDSSLDVDGGYYQDGSQSASYRYHVVRGDRGWTVGKSRILSETDPDEVPPTLSER